MINPQFPEIQLELFHAVPPMPDAKARARERNAEAQQLYQARPENPPKMAERHEVKRALAQGGLSRPGLCADCGAACAPEAHHPNYALPLAVVWLCRDCHMRRHRLPWSLPGQTTLEFEVRP